MALEISDPLEVATADTGPFIKVGTSFACNKSKWTGMALASADAIYLMKTAEMKNHGHHGLVGVLIAEAFSKTADRMRTCTVASLPDLIREQLDPKGKLDNKDVVIIPRNTVNLVKSSKWNNTIALTVGRDSFVINSHLFRFRAIPREMEAAGWTFNTPLEPTAEPMHDLRSLDEIANPPQKPLWQRVLMIAGAVALVILVVAIKAMAHHP